MLSVLVLSFHSNAFDFPGDVETLECVPCYPDHQWQTQSRSQESPIFLCSVVCMGKPTKMSWWVENCVPEGLTLLFSSLLL